MNPPFRPADRPARPADARDTAGGSRTAPQPTPPPREPRPGEVVATYRILREIGRGGMAVVYEAEDTELPRRIALKVLVEADPQAKMRFVREAHAQAKVSHENVVTIFRVGEDRGVSYIAMPILKGQSLAQALDATPRPPLAAVLRIAAEMADGLAAAHAVGLIHRDIKPSNVWLEAPKWRVKILDFGLARAPHHDSLGDITLRGQVLGTPAFMSPEQAAGHAVDFRTDLWSLGVVLYQMTTGEKPFAGDTSLNLMAAIVSAEPPAPLALAPDLPPALSDLVLRLLAKNPAQRPASAAAVAAELTALARAVPGPSLASAPAVVWQPPAPTAAVPALPSVPAVPSVVAPQAPADPWGNLDATEVEERPARRPRRDRDEDDDYDDRPRRKRRDRDDDRDPPRSLKGVWLGLLSAVALLLVGALVWMAANAVSPAAKPTAATAEKPKELQPQTKIGATTPKPPDTDRAAAEALIGQARLKVQIDGRSPVEVAAGGQLPAGRLTITEIDFERNDVVGPAYVTATLLPALAQLRSLAEIRMSRYQLTITPEQLRQMAAMPLANTLARLDARVELTPASAADLRKFTAMEDLTVYAPNPSDALFERLSELVRLKLLTFHSLQAAGLTDRGWAAVAGMPLDLLSLVDSPAAPEALRGLTVRRSVAPPPLAFLNCEALTDDHLRQLGERPTDLQTLMLYSVGVTNAGLLHLADVSSLRNLRLQRVRATEAGARALYGKRPDMKIVFDEKLIDRKN
jgi:serine/threonine protein kinase